MSDRDERDRIYAESLMAETWVESLPENMKRLPRDYRRKVSEVRSRAHGVHVAVEGICALPGQHRPISMADLSHSVRNLQSVVITVARAEYAVVRERPIRCSSEDRYQRQQ